MCDIDMHFTCMALRMASVKETSNLQLKQMTDVFVHHLAKRCQAVLIELHVLNAVKAVCVRNQDVWLAKEQGLAQLFCLYPKNNCRKLTHLLKTRAR